ncbi:LysR family transcriptional regulator [Roseibium salinum]|uniref:LysR family transcriptional regulator n=1 Tax=Roseibium salinum TaxID=1604349 RepID=A0ABT3QWY1_9HYPH|nr:LysR family transcriptional regulator [Roseibium sp. DSM 29163]MCX2721437.1 LysR family transcriptional regulator [Roseibium sp. DSM 29163]
MSKSVDPLGVDFRALQVLICVHQLRSFTRAAEELGVNQSAVSYTIDKLRNVFQDPLFVRQARRLHATARCDGIVHEAERLTTEFRQLAAPPEFDPHTAAQKFTIACNFYERVLIIPDIVHALKKEAPQLDLEIIDSAGIGHERLRLNEADLLLGPFERDEPYFFRRDLYKERYVCLLDPSHPKAGGDLSLEDYLGLEHVLVTYGGQWRSRYIIELERQGRELKVAIRVPSPAGLELLVSGSDLVATVPERLAKVVGQGLRILPCPVQTTIAIRLVWTTLTHRSPIHMWVRDMVYRSTAATRREW